MQTRTLFSLAPSCLIVLAPLASCVTTTETSNGQSTAGCPEFSPGTTVDASLMVDARVRSFMQASADLDGVAASLKAAVKTACIGIASDLGATDTWSSMGDSDDAIANGNGTGACDAASAKIVAIMNAHPNANFALLISRGECHTDFNAEAQCESGCTSTQVCQPGTVVTRCDPAQLSVVCDGNCEAQGTCEGTVNAAANCQGQCEAVCTGHCSGTCTDATGHRTSNDPNCHGKCTDGCSGTCNGRCQITVSGGVACGTNVYCKAGCTSDYTQPRCESQCTPPSCTIDQSCFENCRASVSSKAVCDPPTVQLFADTTTGPDVAKLVATIDKNMPPLIQAAEAQGSILVAEVQNLGVSGKAVLDASGSLDLKSVSCATVAAESLTTSASTLQVATTAGAAITQNCASHAE